MARNRAQALPLRYRMIKRLTQLVVGVFYRRVDVVTEEPLAADRPAILALNHTNGLADSVVIIAKTSGYPRFLAAASWWKVAPARWLFDGAGVLPLHRRRESEDTSQNLSSFAACEAALADGAQIAIHPEGEMHQNPELMPLRTGAARIALGALGSGLDDLIVVPHAIVYADRGRFRSEAAVNVGMPISVAEWSDQYRTDPKGAVRGLTQLIADGMRAVTLNFDTAEGAELIEDAAALALADAAEGLESRPGYGARHALARALGVELSATGGTSSPAFRELDAAVRAHRADLESIGVPARRARPRFDAIPQSVRRRNALGLAALTPLATIGMIANGPIALAAAVADHQVRGEGWNATTKGVTGLLLCPIVWGLETFAAARFLGVRRAFFVAVAAPVGGWAWIAWRARLLRDQHARWADRIAAEQPDALAAARTSRAHVRKLVEVHLDPEQTIALGVPRPATEWVGTA